jgi:DegV family protein with EDD domain
MSASSIAIIADSTCDIPAELIERHHIDIVSQIIIWGNEELRDRVDIQPGEFYQRLSTAPQLPTTSQPTVKSFGEHYRAAQDEGATDIVVLTVSSAMSGTYQAALNLSEIEVMIEAIRAVRSQGVTIIMIEHVMRATMTLSDRLIVLDYGKQIAEGAPADVAENPRVIEAYLGEPELARKLMESEQGHGNS